MSKIDEEMKRHFAHQDGENSRLADQILKLSGEKTNLQQQLLAMQRRITEIDVQVGQEDN